MLATKCPIHNFLKIDSHANQCNANLLICLRGAEKKRDILSAAALPQVPATAGPGWSLKLGTQDRSFQPGAGPQERVYISRKLKSETKSGLIADAPTPNSVFSRQCLKYWDKHLPLYLFLSLSMLFSYTLWKIFIWFYF